MTIAPSAMIKMAKQDARNGRILTPNRAIQPLL
jgi:hypothetical protein